MAAPELCFGFVGVEAMGVGVGYCCVEDCERSLEGGGRGGGGFEGRGCGEDEFVDVFLVLRRSQRQRSPQIAAQMVHITRG